MDPKRHWDKVYTSKTADALSWYQVHADHSLRLIADSGVPLSAAIIDVGGGASTLVDDLLAAGYQNVTVLDVSRAALQVARRRLGKRAESVHWLTADITEVQLPAQAYELWHDRALFHFLTEPEQRAAYVAAVLRCTKPGGHVIVAAFAEDGPTHCSGLPVMRYSADELDRELGGSLVLIHHHREAHQTPLGTVQPLVYCYWRKLPW